MQSIHLSKGGCELNTPLLKDVFNYDKCIHCRDNDEAKQILIDLKSLLGNIDGDILEPGKLSNRQFYVAVAAVSKVRNRNLVGAVSKVYDFV